MRVVKDTPLQLGWLTWQIRPPQTTLVCVVKATYELVAQGVCPLAETQDAVTGDLFWDDDADRVIRYDSDLAVSKPRAEWWVTGTWRAPPNRTVRHHTLTAGVSGQRKRVALIGDRYWQPGVGGGITSPAPLTQLALSWERSFGGPDISANPRGAGVAPDPSDPESRVRLPNIEDPDRLIGSPDQRPRPIGLSAVPRSYPERARLTGTYDGAYMRERWPWFPADFRWEHFLAAPQDQRRDGYYRGDELLELDGGPPTLPSARCRLPGLVPRLFFAPERLEANTPLVAVPMVLDTIVLDVEGRAHAVWRGYLDGVDDKLTGLGYAFLVDEPMDRPSAPEHYRAWLDRKLAEEDAEDEAFEPRAPQDDATGDAEGAGLDAGVAPASPPARPDAEELRNAQREALLTEGLAPSIVERLLPATPPAPPVSDPAREAAERAAAIVAARELGREDIAGALESLDEPDERPPAEAPPSGAAAPEAPDGTTPDPSLRALVQRALEDGTPLAGSLLPGADLSGLDLSGRDLSRCVLVGANLSGARFVGTKLDGAVLDDAIADDACFDGASLLEAHFDRLRGERVSMRGATLEDAHGEAAHLPGVDLREAKASRLELPKSYLAAANCEGATLDEAELSGSDLSGASFIDASLVDAWLDRGTRAARACFEGARVEKLRASEGDFRETSFKWAKANGARFGRSHLDRANFSFAELAEADFSEAHMAEAVLLSVQAPGARFQDAVLIGAQLGKANLHEARFEGANLEHADLRASNLFGAELWRARTEHAQFELANLRRTKREGA